MYSTKKRTLGLIAAIVALALAAVLFATLMSVFVVQRDKYRDQLENAYERAYYELVSSVNNLEVKLSKLMVVSGAAQSRRLLEDISKQADEAEADLGCIPLDGGSIRAVSGFLNQLNGYSSHLLKQVGEGKKLSEEHYSNLDALHRACKFVSDELYRLTGELGGGYYFTSNHTKSGRLENPLKDLFEGINENTLEYPELIFDGPFSSAKTAAEPRGLDGDEILPDEGAAIVARCFPGAENIRYEGECRAASLDALCYLADCPSRGALYVQLAKKGGLPLLMSCPGNEDQRSLDRGQAAEAAVKAAENMGFSDMQAVWYCETGNYATINLAPSADGIILYPDLVKLKISLADAKILGLEAVNYAYHHTDRKLTPPVYDAEGVKKKISERLDLISERLAVIPAGNGEERLAYEISAAYDGLQYFVYVDAETGEETQIFRVVDTEQGQLLL